MFIMMVFWRPQEWLVPALFGWPLLDAVIFMSMLAMLLEYDSGKLNLDTKRPHVFLLFGLFFAGLMSHIGNFYFAGLMASWMTAFRICLFGLLLYAAVNTTEKMIWIARAFVFMGCFMAVHSILQQTRGYGFGGMAPVMSWRPNMEGLVPRSQYFGIFNDPNDMGQMMATAMPLCFVITKRKSFLGLLLGVGLCYLLWIGIEGAISRGSEIGVFVAVAVMIIQIFPARWFLRLFGLGVVCGLGLLPFSGRFLEGSALERMDFWGQANWAFKTRPLFGVGLNLVNDYIDKGRAVHNAYVTCYAELGVFGYFFWFTLILVTIYGLVQTKTALLKQKSLEAEWLHRFSCWGLASFCGFLASSYFLSRAFVFPLFFLFSMLGAVPYLAAELKEDDRFLHLPTTGECATWGLPLSIASIVYVYFSIVLLNMAR
jgi:putative inorganic carbon (hco3(-)) transporter